MSWISSLLGIDAQKNASRATNAQNAIAKQQLGLMQQASPYYGSILQFLAQNAGLQLPQTTGIAGPVQAPAQPKPGFSSVSQLATMQAGGQANIQPIGPRLGANGSPIGAQPGGQAGALGVYGTNPADVYRFQQAQEDVDRQANQRARTLQYQLGQQGLGNSATAGAALARNQQDAQTQLANFRRNLAVQAGTEQERRVQQLLAAMGIGNAAGGQAASIYGQTAGLQQQQGQQQQQLLASLLPLLF